MIARIPSGEIETAVINREVRKRVGKYSTREGICRNNLVGIRRYPVAHPQPHVARCVKTFEVHQVVEDDRVARVEAPAGVFAMPVIS